MKKILLLSSITAMTLWIIGYFILRLPAPVHILLAASILIYIRSLLVIDDSATQKYYRAKKYMK